MATGLPCIASDLACIPEIVENGRSGMLVEPGDPAALANALEKMILSPSLRQALGTAARQRVVEQFDLDKSADRFIEYVGSVVERHAGGSPPAVGR